MRTRIFAVAAVMAVAIPAAAEAQMADPVWVEASAQVVAQTTLTRTAQLNFGDLSMDANGDVLGEVDPTEDDGRRGVVEISHNSVIRVEAGTLTELVHSEGGSLNFVLSCAVAENGEEAELAGTCSEVTFGSIGTPQNSQFFLGGVVSGKPVRIGTYSGWIEIKAIATNN
jgi:hypothetical protein